MRDETIVIIGEGDLGEDVVEIVNIPPADTSLCRAHHYASLRGELSDASLCVPTVVWRGWRIMVWSVLVLVLALGVLVVDTVAAEECAVFDGIGENVSALWMATKDVTHPDYDEAMALFTKNAKGDFVTVFGVQSVIAISDHGEGDHVFLFAGMYRGEDGYFHPTCGVWEL